MIDRMNDFDFKIMVELNDQFCVYVNSDEVDEKGDIYLSAYFGEKTQDRLLRIKIKNREISSTGNYVKKLKALYKKNFLYYN